MGTGLAQCRLGRGSGFRKDFSHLATGRGGQPISKVGAERERERERPGTAELLEILQACRLFLKGSHQ